MIRGESYVLIVRMVICSDVILTNSVALRQCMRLRLAQPPTHHPRILSVCTGMALRGRTLSPSIAVHCRRIYLLARTTSKSAPRTGMMPITQYLQLRSRAGRER